MTGVILGFDKRKMREKARVRHFRFRRNDVSVVYPYKSKLTATDALNSPMSRLLGAHLLRQLYSELFSRVLTQHTRDSRIIHLGSSEE